MSMHHTHPENLQRPSRSPHHSGSHAEGAEHPFEDDLSHYLHYDDNAPFFPPSDLGEKPPSQHSEKLSSEEPKKVPDSPDEH
ncbi:hypothetical protein BJX96DRAFT_156498 [Aspergillus floccosus]